MSEILVLFVLPLAILASVVSITRILADYRLRMRLVDTGAPAEVVAALGDIAARAERLGALKWGLVAIGVGLAAGLAPFLPPSRIPLTFGLALILGGAALILFHRLTTGRD